MHAPRLSGLLVAVAGVLVVLGGFASTASSTLRPGVGGKQLSSAGALGEARRVAARTRR
jgi:hypothetical protein